MTVSALLANELMLIVCSILNWVYSRLGGWHDVFMYPGGVGG